MSSSTLVECAPSSPADHGPSLAPIDGTYRPHWQGFHPRTRARPTADLVGAHATLRCRALPLFYELFLDYVLRSPYHQVRRSGVYFPCVCSCERPTGHMSAEQDGARVR